MIAPEFVHRVRGRLYDKHRKQMRLTVLPVTHGRWADLEAVFKAKGCSVARGCWCMAYRRSGAEKLLAAGTSRAEANRADLKALVDAGKAPGLIAYRGKVPVGWVSLAPREEFARLKRSPVMKPVDDKPVWSVVCFVVPSAHRGQGVAHALLRGAIAYACKRGAALIEAYPVDKKRSIQRRHHVVRSQVHVRPRRLQGSGAPQTDAARRSAREFEEAPKKVIPTKRF